MIWTSRQADRRGVWRFLALLSASAIIGVVFIGRTAWAQSPYAYRQAVNDPLRRQKSKVVEEVPDQVYDVYGDYVIRGTKVHHASLRAIINTGIKKLSGSNDLHEAWRRYIHDDDVIALNFTRVGGKALNTNQALAAALLQCLYKAGFTPNHFMLVGLDELPDEAAGTRKWKYGWQQEKVDFGSDSDYLASWLNEVTAIINVPSIMDDHILGLRGAMVNVTLPLIKSPARFYQYHTQGDPFVAEIYDLPQIRGKVRLHIANALRMLYYGGPMVKQKYVNEYGAILFSVDPVALDLVALKLLCRARRENPLPTGVSETIEAAYLHTAQDLGLGYNDLNFIDYEHVKHEKEAAKPATTAPVNTGPVNTDPASELPSKAAEGK